MEVITDYMSVGAPWNGILIGVGVEIFGLFVIAR
jgi:hypothetical protein